MAMSENSRKILNYLKEMNGTNLTAADVASALGLEKKTVDGAFTSAIQRKGLGVRTPAEIELEDGTVIKCTPNHRLRLKDGSYKEAQYLTENDELMDIQVTYNEFINNIIKTRGQWGIKKGEYKEVHHIIPKCMGGLPNNKTLSYAEKN